MCYEQGGCERETSIKVPPYGTHYGVERCLLALCSEVVKIAGS
jgi:hypothetical protein